MEKKSSTNNDALPNRDTYNGDNSTVGSARELDKYGVWVKSESPSLGPAENGNPTMAIPEEKLEIDIFDDIESEEFAHPSLEAEHISGEPVQDTVLKASLNALADLEEPAGTAENPEDTPGKTPIPANEQGSLSWFPISDASLQLLTNILGELTSIKKELSDFKALVQDKIAVEKPAEAEAEKSVQEGPEKIVLAGDELDNILNSAEFTEEAEVPNPVLGIAPVEDLEFLKEAVPQIQELAVPAALQVSGTKDKKPDPFSIDDLLIENGSMKDIPIELNMEEEEESENQFEEEPFVLDTGNMEEVPIPISFAIDDDLGPSGVEVLGEAALDLNSIIFPGDEIDISDEELDRLERNILLEFSDKLPVIDEIFGYDEQDTKNPDTKGSKKKTYK